jgi:uncharacterized protein YbjT (DUF2867 family)
VVDRPMVLVAGATGYAGGHVVRALSGAGYRVRALVRDVARLGELRALCDEVVVAEATRRESLDGVLGDASIVFSSIGKRDFHRRPTLEQVDGRANLNLLERAAARGSIERFVFVSVFNGKVLREAGVPLAAARERVVDAIAASGVPYTVLRPTGFFNDMETLFRMAKRGTGWVIGDGSTRINPIHGADLADAVVRALGDQALVGSEVALGGPERLSYSEILELAFACLGRTPRLRRFPAPVLRWLAPLVTPFNGMAGGMMLALYQASRLDFCAPAVGTRRLADFYRDLAASTTGG